MTAYFDHNASSPLHADVLQCMLPYMQHHHANPSSLHRSGRIARDAVEAARRQVANAVKCEPQQVIFTSGGTEANNMVLQANKQYPFYIGAVEHASVLEPAKKIKAINLISVDQQGQYHLDIDSLEPAFISLQLVNNETGVIQPIARVKNHYPESLVHADAAQALGKIEVNFKQLNIDFLTLSAHKFNGPKGAGALIVKKPEAIKALVTGGLQERNLRAGTENVAALVGMGLAAELAQQHITQRILHFTSVRDYFEKKLKQISGVTVFSEHANRVSNTCFFALPFFHGETFLMECDRAGFELASGSACHSSMTTPSHVLQAMNIDESLSLNAVRASFGVDNTRQQIDEFIQFIQDKLENLPASIKSALDF